MSPLALPGTKRQTSPSGLANENKKKSPKKVLPLREGKAARHVFTMDERRTFLARLLEGE